jgi:hypothetical protein
MRRNPKICDKMFPITLYPTNTIMRRHLKLYHYKIKILQMRTSAYKQRRREFCRDVLQFVQQYPATWDCLRFSDETHFQQDGFMYWQNTRFRVSENPHRIVMTSMHIAKRTVWCAVSSSYLTDLCGRHQISGRYSKCKMRSFWSFRKQGI